MLATTNNLNSGSTVIALLAAYIVVPVSAVLAVSLTGYLIYALIKREKIYAKTIKATLLSYAVLLIAITYLITRQQ